MRDAWRGAIVRPAENNSVRVFVSITGKAMRRRAAVYRRGAVNVS